MRSFARQVAAGMVVVLMWGGTVGAAQRPPTALPDVRPAVLDVPYLAQSVLLCGGAAVAMVERWWGRRGVYAEDFADLVRPELGGILTTELDSATRARGWATRTFKGTRELVEAYLEDRVPVIALIQVAPDRYHYVVVLGWDSGTVVFHDPAGSPSTTLSESRFLAQWQGTDHWAMAIQPAAAAPSDVAETPPLPASPSELPCSPWLDQALDAVATGALDEAIRLLVQARRACPTEPMVLRELAAVRFRQGFHATSAELVVEYLALAPDDDLAWQLLATSLYLLGDADGALRAWNRIGRPTVDLLRIDGMQRIRFQQLASMVSISHGTVLTPRMLALARRRLTDTPALRAASMSYQPVVGGVVELSASVATRPTVAPLWRLAAAGAVGALSHETPLLEVASPTGAGELWTGQWKWDPARSRAAIRLAVPARLGVPGVVAVDGAWDRVRVAIDPTTDGILEDSWRTAGIRFDAWVTPSLRPSVALGLERWSRDRSYLTLSVGTALRASGDRLQVAMAGVQAFAPAGETSYRRGSARAMWASSLGMSRTAWSGRVGMDWASRPAPLGVWPVAGGNLTQPIPLRAEPSRRGGPLPGRALGRVILHAGLTGEQPVYRVGPVVVAVGAFLDAARVIDAAVPSVTDRTFLDVGGGIRIGLAEGELGVLRLDVARGLLQERGVVWTVGFHQSWPPFPQASR